LEVEALVDDPVAVVVEAVADLDAPVRGFAFTAVGRLFIGVDEVPDARGLARAILARGNRVRRRAVVEALATVEGIREAVGRGIITELNSAIDSSATAAPRSAHATHSTDVEASFGEGCCVEVEVDAWCSPGAGVDRLKDAAEVIETLVTTCHQREEKHRTHTTSRERQPPSYRSPKRFAWDGSRDVHG
jgi:hypothetical protein